MEQQHYSVKFPRLSDFNVIFYLTFLCEVIFLAGLFVWFGSRLSGQFVYFCTAAILLVTGSRIQLIRKYLIAKLQASLSENIKLSEKYKEYANLLLRESALVSEYRKRETRIRYAILLLVFFLFIGTRVIHLSGVKSFNFLWILAVVSLTVIALEVVQNVMNYFASLIDLNYDRIVGYEGFVTSGHISALKLERYLLKWKKLELISFILACICSLVLLILGKGAEAIYLLLVLSAILLVLITLDLGKIIKSTLPLLAQYDDFVKRRIGITFSAPVTDRGASEFSDELNKNVKDFFK